MALDPSSETPLYRQISMWFQRAILSGKLQPGQRVPSTRALAKELRISRIPVLSAYELLIADGYLQSFTGAGTCVSRSIPDGLLRPQALREGPAVAAHPRARRAVSRRAQSLGGAARAWLQDAAAARTSSNFPPHSGRSSSAAMHARPRGT